MENKDFDLKLLQSTWNLLFKSDYVISEGLEKAIKGKLDFHPENYVILKKFNIERKTWPNAFVN